MVTKSGIKLLDFGLARAVEPLFRSSRSIVETEAAAQLTAEGTVTGTLQYMAPEQLEGRPADTRSDIFAFGAMLYEMATGKKAFSAGSPVALASAILHAQPPAMTSVDGALPTALDRVVRTCLAKDPDQRWQSARDVELQLRVIADSREGVASSPSPPAAVGGRRGWIRWAPWGVAAAALIVSAVTVALRPGRVATRPSIVKFLQQPPPGGAFFVGYENTGLSISPDGTQIAFSARDASGIYRIWLRPVGALEAAALPGTDGPTSMFWSPDGRSLAFFTASKLRRVDLPGGAPVSICDVREGIGFSGTWGADGQILFASIEGEAIYGVAASGGVPAPVLKPDPKRNEARLNWPFFLPDGRRFLYLQRARDGNGHLTLAEPGRAPREVMPVQASVQYVEPGYLVFVREGALVGQRFDASRGTVMGAPFSIADQVSNFLSTTVARFATSANGSLVYQSHDEEQRLAWFDRAGRELGMVGPPGQYKNPRISPDDRRVAFDRLRGGAFDVWEADLERGGETRLTFGVSSEGAGPWTADGRALFFNADQGAPPVILRKNLTTGTDEPVVPPSGTMQEPHDISPDGKTLLYTQRGAGGDHIWCSRWTVRTPAAAFNTPFEEFGVRFSRDGRHSRTRQRLRGDRRSMSLRSAHG
jgi:hypothetical protein